MEPTDARRAFPCWDEPALKAVFEVVLTVPKDKTCLANTAVVRTEEDKEKGVITYTFGATPKMSTYLRCQRCSVVILVTCFFFNC